MKTKLLLMLLLWAGVVWGQEAKCKKIEKKESNSNILVLDPFGIDTLNGQFKEGEFVKFKIKNVNIFKVNGYTKTVSSNIAFDIPSELSANLGIAKNTAQTNPIDITTMLEMMALSQEKKDSIIQSLTKEQTFAVVYNRILADMRKVKLFTELEDKLLNKLSDSIFVNECLLKDLAKSDYNAVYDKNEMEVEDKKIIINTLETINKNYVGLLDIYNDINKDKPQKAESKISGKFQSKDGNTTIEIKDAVISKKSELVFSKEVKEIEMSLKKIRSDSANVIKKAHAGIDLFHKINKSEFTIYTAPQQLNDNINVITPELRNNKGKVVYTYNPITIKVYNAWKVDFSAGYFLSFAGNDNYSSFSNSKGDKEVAKGKKDKIINALGGLMHVYKLKNPDCKFPQWGLSFGASLSDNTNIGFYGGPSLFFLEKNRMVITGGYSFIKIKKINLSNLISIAESPSYSFANKADTEIRYDNLYQGAWFFGVTYNLSNNNNEKK